MKPLLRAGLGVVRASGENPDTPKGKTLFIRLFLLTML